MAANLIHFIPASREAAILELPVSRLFAVAHEDLGSTNHWCFYLQTSRSSSVQLDCQPSHSIPGTILKGGSKANLIISELPYVVPPETEAAFPLDVQPGLLVGGVYARIVDNGIHKYEFNEFGVGCRKWVTDQLDFLYRAALVIDQGQVANAKDGILKLWPKQTFNPLDCGAYYGDSG